MNAETWLWGWIAIAVVCGIVWPFALGPRREAEAAAAAEAEDLSPCPYGMHNTLCGACGVCACHPSACPDCWGCHTPGCVGHCRCHMEVTA